MNLRILDSIYAYLVKIKSNKKMAFMTFINIIIAIIFSLIKDPSKANGAEIFVWLYSVYMEILTFLTGLMGQEVFNIVITILSIVFYGVPALWLAAIVCPIVVKAFLLVNDKFFSGNLMPKNKEDEIENNHLKLKEESEKVFENDRQNTYLRIQRVLPVSSINENREEIKAWSSNKQAKISIIYNNKKIYYDFYMRGESAYVKEINSDEEIELTLNEPSYVEYYDEEANSHILFFIVTWIGRKTKW